jgi:hypothetical protein
MYNWTPALGLRLEDPLSEESAAIEKLFDDVPRTEEFFSMPLSSIKWIKPCPSREFLLLFAVKKEIKGSTSYVALDFLAPTP